MLQQKCYVYLHFTYLTIIRSIMNEIYEILIKFQ